MKVVLEGQIGVFRRMAAALSDKACIVLEAHGKVIEGHRGPDSQQASATVQMLVKPIILEHFPTGAKLYVVITDQKPEEAP